MSRYLAHRLSSMLLVLLGISLLAFILGVISPGDPVEIALSQGGIHAPTAEQIDAMRERLGLNDPLHIQYIRWLGGAVRGDLGVSYFTGRAVSTELARRLPVTLRLSAYSFILACVIGFPLGILSAAYRGRLLDRCVKVFVNVLLSFPNFWLALLLILVMVEILGWLPSSGLGGPRHMIMPAITLSSAMAAGLARLMRSSLLAELGKQYFLAANARGLGRASLLLRTAFPNAALPAVAMLGNFLGGILGGSVVVETMFALPGIGSYAIEAIAVRDYPALQGYVLLIGFVFVIVTFAVDVISALLDPRIRLGGRPA
ncbi:MAG: ABC transporter permease [Defluviitaleaceae bacterium]|nr:ABC transporter permease [Defluviitaleaceae bacterium]